MNLFKSLFFGLTLPIQAFILILKKPKLLLWSIIPVLLSLLFYSFITLKIYSVTVWLLNYLLNYFGLQPDHWIFYLFTWTTRFIILLVTLFLTAITFSGFSNLISCPINDFLAEATEKYIFPPLSSTIHLSLFQRVRLFSIDFMKTFFVILSQLVLFLFHWIPLINIVSIILAFLLMSFQYVSYPQTRRGQGILDGLKFLIKNFFLCVGFGASLTFLFNIPWISCFFIPLAVVGGTLLVGEAQNKTLK